VLIGLIVGAVLAVGVALWVAGSNPFKSAPAGPVACRIRRNGTRSPEAAPSFDFYKVLRVTRRANCRPQRHPTQAPRCITCRPARSRMPTTPTI